MVEEDMRLLRKSYRISSDIGLMILEPNARACFPRRGRTVLHLHAFVGGLRLPMHPFFLKDSACVWFGTDTETLPRCQLSSNDIEILRSIYQAPPSSQRYRFLLYRQCCLTELGLMTSQAEMDRWMCPRPTIARLASKKSRVLALSSSEDSKQKKVIEELSREGNREEAEPEGKAVEVMDKYAVYGVPSLQRTLLVNPSGEVVLESPPQVTQNPRSPIGEPYDSKKKLRELIGAPGLRMLDDALRNVPFYPSMGAQVVKKYFTPKWEEFASHGDLEDVLEASLAAAIRASTMQLKVLRKFRTRMQEHKKLVTKASKEFESNVLNLTKQLDNANAAQKVAAKALEAANKEKRRLLDEAKSHEQETQSLRENLEVAKTERKEAEAEVARLLGEKKEMEAKLGNVDTEFVANFHNTEAYTYFSDYFTKVGHQEVLTVLRIDHPSIDLRPLEG
ncbi:putative abhydrolase domain-containing protein [Abeliophyllum distichum]|uniref:Abhydrolase domain-containing protein n=1 Tax=Abeliophyllum distichum TaxID=126358 RepID=A0ABD1V6T4_9LAMI